MNILIVSATYNEIEPIIKKLNFEKDIVGYTGIINKNKIRIVITGIGVPNTMFSLMRELEGNTYGLVINIGVAGSFLDELKIGTVVNVTKDCFADIGYESGNEFVPFSKTELFDANKFPFSNGCLVNNSELLANDFKEVRGITVNTVHGNLDSISKFVALYQPDVESMEGAAIAFCCLQYHVNFMQLRAISNKVEVRNKENWNIPLAINNLNKALEDYIKTL